MSDQATASDSPTLVERISLSHPHYQNAGDGTLEDHSVLGIEFFKRFKLHRATLMAHGHVLPIKFLDDGKNLFVLDGTPSAINEAANIEMLKLTEGQAKPFLKFYFQHVGNGELTIVESVEEVQGVPAKRPLKWANDANLRQLVKPFRAEPQGDHFVLKFTGVWESLLVEMTMLLQTNGTLIPQTQTMLKT
jgi:hypothetical protein